MPYIIRIIDNVKIKLVPVRVAENDLLKKYLASLAPYIYENLNIKSYYFTIPEAILFNSINIEHCNLFYGRDKFWAGKDILVQYEDLCNFYNFFDLCYKISVLRNSSTQTQFGGFVQIDLKYILAYCIKDGIKYVPLIFFKYIPPIFERNMVIINNWEFAYLRYFLGMQRLNYKLGNNDYCQAISLDYVMEFFPPGTELREFLPTFNADNIVHGDITNRSAIWVKPPDLEDNTTFGNILPSNSLPAPHVVPPLGIVNNPHQNEQLSNQMVRIKNSINSILNVMLLIYVDCILISLI